jgi:RHS repeat-associated protein
MSSLIRHRYTDQEFDAETGLYNYNARLYDPSIARFISPDTIVENPYSSLALNRYMYVAGNPLRYTDPSGHLTLKKLGRAFVTGLVAGLCISNPFLAGMAAGAMNSFLSGGGLQGMFIGGTIGAITGSFGAVGYSGLSGAIGSGMAAGVMLGAGAVAAYAQGGWNGVGYFAAGVAGGMTGASWGESGKEAGGPRSSQKEGSSVFHV